MKIIYNDRVVIPCTTPINCRQCVFCSNDFCKAAYFCKRRDLRVQVFRGDECLGFRYEDSI